jgi:hypothetical protein
VTDDEQLAVLLGLNAHRARQGLPEVKFALLGSFAILGLTAADGALNPLADTLRTTPWVPLLAGVAVVVLAAWYAGRLTYRADAETDARLGGKSVVQTMQWLLDEQGASRDRSVTTNLLYQTRSVGSRLDRLQRSGDVRDHGGSES